MCSVSPAHSTFCLDLPVVSHYNFKYSLDKHTKDALTFNLIRYNNRNDD